MVTCVCCSESATAGSSGPDRRSKKAKAFGEKLRELREQEEKPGGEERPGGEEERGVVLVPVPAHSTQPTGTAVLSY